MSASGFFGGALLAESIRDGNPFEAAIGAGMIAYALAPSPKHSSSVSCTHEYQERYFLNKVIEQEQKKREQEEKERVETFKSHIKLIDAAKNLEYEKLCVEIKNCYMLSSQSLTGEKTVYAGLPKNPQGENIFHSLFANERLTDSQKLTIFNKLFYEMGYQEIFKQIVIYDKFIVSKMLDKKEFHSQFNNIFNSLIYRVNFLKYVNPEIEKKVLFVLNQKSIIQLFFSMRDIKLAKSYMIEWISSRNQGYELEDLVKNTRSFYRHNHFVRSWSLHATSNSEEIRECFDAIEAAAKQRMIILYQKHLISDEKNIPITISKNDDTKFMIDMLEIIKSNIDPNKIISLYNQAEEKLLDKATPLLVKQLNLIHKVAKMRILELDLELARKKGVKALGQSYEDELKKMNFLNTHRESRLFSFWPTTSRSIYDQLHEGHQRYEAQVKFDKEQIKLDDEIKQFRKS